VNALVFEAAPGVAVDDREIVVGAGDVAGVFGDAAEPAVAAKQRRHGRRRHQVDADAALGEQAARGQVHQGVADLRRIGMEPDRALPGRIDALDAPVLLPAEGHLGAAAQHAPGELEVALAGEKALVVGGDRLGDRLRHRAAGQRRERPPRRPARARHRLSRGSRPIR
jgi:hypothetical protein